MYNERAEYMKSVGKIAVTALITMAELWEQIEFEREDAFEELFDYYSEMKKNGGMKQEKMMDKIDMSNNNILENFMMNNKFDMMQ